MKRRIIKFVNLTVKHKTKLFYLNKVVYKARKDGKYHNLRELKKHGLKEAVIVVKVEVLNELGYETLIASKQNN